MAGRRYSQEFDDEAVKLVVENGTGVRTAAARCCSLSVRWRHGVVPWPAGRRRGRIRSRNGVEVT